MVAWWMLAFVSSRRGSPATGMMHEPSGAVDFTSHPIFLFCRSVCDGHGRRSDYIREMQSRRKAATTSRLALIEFTANGRAR